MCKHTASRLEIWWGNALVGLFTISMRVKYDHPQAGGATAEVSETCSGFNMHNIHPYHVSSSLGKAANSCQIVDAALSNNH